MSEQKKLLIVKQQYFRPVIQVYGNIRTITQAFGNSGNKDNGTAPNIRTAA